MAKKLSKAYQSKKYEDEIYQRWEQSGFFNPDNLALPKNAPHYTVILPPPNITDKLHMGHASLLAIEDLMVRFHRMQGFRTLWLPGTDHASIATQNVVEKKLLQEKKQTRHDLGRKKFLKEVWKFLEKTQAIILHQTKKMGSSLDWSRKAFTLDEPRQKAVKEMFTAMYQAGAIYRGERIVNWCPRCHSTLADDEVEHQDQKATLYTFRYWKDFPIAISTTRPETKLGDVAVAVNPRDKRYRQFIGKKFKGKFCGITLEIKVIADQEVAMNFGTGALGVTPAHSTIDWKMAETNNLKIKKVIDENGKIHSGFNNFSQLTAKNAGQLIIKRLKKDKLLEKEEEIDNALSTCYRCNTAIEPLPSQQWFISVNKPLKKLGGKSLKEKALAVVKNKQIVFIPPRFKKSYIDWMENLHDWCISRQIWFGHQIPVWYKGNKTYVGVNPPREKGWTQDPDTLDTWFSSGMWTFSTLGWPDNFKHNKKTGDLKKFHPTQVLETGYEIITLWVSRMIMMSLFALGEIPFEKVYLHGMVQDKLGKKMSKSKGNGIDPLEMIEKYGADASRLPLLIGNTPGNDLKLSEEKIAHGRNMINKLWNISRYILENQKLEFKNSSLKKLDLTKLTLADKWILKKVEQLIKKVTQELTVYHFSSAGEKLREFTWNDLADWYLEISKFENNQTEKMIILNYLLQTILKLWHPFIPFVTEKIWGEINKDKLLMITSWPQTDQLSTKLSSQISSDFDLIKNIITVVRNARAQYQISPAKKIKVIIYSPKNKSLITSQQNIIKNLRTNIETLTVTKTGQKIKKSFFQSFQNIEIAFCQMLSKRLLRNLGQTVFLRICLVRQRQSLH